MRVRNGAHSKEVCDHGVAVPAAARQRVGSALAARWRSSLVEW